MAFSQSEIWANSLVIFCDRDEPSLPLRNKLVSFATSIVKVCLQTEDKSLTYKRNSKGHKMEPYGTSHLINPKLDFTPSYVTLWDLLHK